MKRIPTSWLVPLGMMLFIIATGSCAPKKSQAPAPPADVSSDDICEAGDKADLEQALAVAGQVDDYGKIKACNLRVHSIDISKTSYRNGKVSVPSFTFETSREAAYVTCELTTLKGKSCSETFSVGPFAEYETKCSGDLQIKCRACVDNSVDSCSCGSQAKVAVFKKSDNGFGSGGLQLASSSSLGLTSGSDGRPNHEAYAYSTSGNKLRISEVSRYLTDAQEILASPRANIADILRVENTMEQVTTRLAASVQDASKEFVRALDRKKCKDKLVLGYRNQAINLTQKEPAVYGQLIRAYLQDGIAMMRDLSSGGGLYLAQDSDGDGNTECGDAPVDGDDPLFGDDGGSDGFTFDDGGGGDILGGTDFGGDIGGDTGGDDSSLAADTTGFATDDGSGGFAEDDGTLIDSPDDDGTGADDGTGDFEPDANPGEESSSGGGSTAGKVMGVALVGVGLGLFVYSIYSFYKQYNGKATNVKGDVAKWFKSKDSNSDTGNDAGKVKGMKAKGVAFHNAAQTYDNVNEAAKDSMFVDDDGNLMKGSGAPGEQVLDGEGKPIKADESLPKNQPLNADQKRSLTEPYKAATLEAAEKWQDSVRRNGGKKSTIENSLPGDFDKGKVAATKRFASSSYMSHLDNSLGSDKKSKFNDLDSLSKSTGEGKSTFKNSKAAGWGKGLGTMFGGLAAVTIGGVVLSSAGSSSDDDEVATLEDDPISLALTADATGNSPRDCFVLVDTYLNLMGRFGLYFEALNTLSAQVEEAKSRWSTRTASN